MRIGLVCKSVDPSRGGHERYVNRLINGLTNRGHQITVFAGDDSVPESLRTIGVEGVNVPRLPLGGAIRRWSFNLFAKSLVNEHRSDLDLVFTTGKVDFGDVHRSGGGVHQVFLEECVSPVRRWLPKHLVACRLERRLYESSSRPLVVNSYMVRDQILERFDTDPERVNVIYNGVDTDRYSWPALRSTRAETREKHGLRPDDFVCLFTGGSWKRKGLPHLLDALARVDRPDVKLVTAGHTDERKLRNKVRDLDLTDRVEHVGYTEQLELYYVAADALVFPSRYDAAANVVLEALASGLPVVSTRTNGSSELIDEGENGYVVERAEQVEKLAEAIRNLRSHPDQEELRKKAYETGSKFTMKRHLDEMEQLLKETSSS
jgi:UDP-glucose:(heptosyl)LPS alpha-1,3-glucosyltransferase